MANDPYYFTHDANAVSDPKIRSMIKKYGMEGYGRFWVIIEMLRRQYCYKIEDKPYNWDALAEQMRCSTEELETFLKDCVEIYELFTKDETGFIYSNSLSKRMIHLDQVRAKRVRAAEIMHEKRAAEQW